VTSEPPTAETMQEELFPKLGAVVFAWSGLETRSVQLIWAITDLFPGNVLMSLLTAGLSVVRLWELADDLLKAGPDADLLGEFRAWRKEAKALSEQRNAAVHSQWAPLSLGSGHRVWTTLDVSSRRTKGRGIQPNPIGYDQLDELPAEIRKADERLGKLERELNRRHHEEQETDSS
jgi:hypothetical protein